MFDPLSRNAAVGGFYLSEAFQQSTKETPPMSFPASNPDDVFKRIPGLFRRWELPEVCQPDRRYQIEDAGSHADGTPLLALYVSGLVDLDGPAEADGTVSDWRE